MSDLKLHALVVGGSLSGLCASLALARAGWRVTIIERATGEPPGGAGLGLDRRLLGQVTGVDAAGVPVVSGNRDSAAWAIVRQFLLDVARRTAGVEFIESTTVTGVRDAHDPGADGQVELDSTAGVFAGDLVVGADGVYSVTRRFVAPDHPEASYAGYLLWRGLVREAEVPGGLGGRGRSVEVHTAPGAQLVVYAVPGTDGRTDRGHRRVSYAWYDASRTRLLRDTGCVVGQTVAGTLRADQIPAALIDELGGLARRYWPSPWGERIGLGRYESERLPGARRLVSSGMSWGRSYLASA